MSFLSSQNAGNIYQLVFAFMQITVGIIGSLWRSLKRVKVGLCQIKFLNVDSFVFSVGCFIIRLMLKLMLKKKVEFEES